jgi:hypothetical protein
VPERVEVGCGGRGFGEGLRVGTLGGSGQGEGRGREGGSYTEEALGDERPNDYEEAGWIIKEDMLAATAAAASGSAAAAADTGVKAGGGGRPQSLGGLG